MEGIIVRDGGGVGVGVGGAALDERGGQIVGNPAEVIEEVGLEERQLLFLLLLFLLLLFLLTSLPISSAAPPSLHRRKRVCPGTFERLVEMERREGRL